MLLMAEVEKTTTEMLITALQPEEKIRFRVLCAKTEKTAAQLITVLMDKFEEKV